MMRQYSTPYYVCKGFESRRSTYSSREYSRVSLMERQYWRACRQHSKDSNNADVSVVPVSSAVEILRRRLWSTPTRTLYVPVHT